jgi:DNA mismatch repair ATPase MutS
MRTVNPGASPPPVGNNLALAWPSKRGMLLTGANATGKSTILRTVGCGVLMAQTVGVCPAAAAAVTPLDFVCTMMRVRDSPERGLSRFQAELMRAGHCMDVATKASGTGGGLVLLDEVFAGSSDSESSEACGSRVLDVLTGAEGTFILLSTHQKNLADWAETQPGFESWKMLPTDFVIARGRNLHSNATEQMERIVGAT